jgi:hypothetical protein
VNRQKSLAALGVRRRGTARRPYGKQRAIRWRLVGDDIARVSEVDGPGERCGAHLQSDRTRRARCAMKGCLEVASQIVVLERCGEKDDDINRHLNAHRSERTKTPHLANH